VASASLKDRVIKRIEERVCPVCAFRGADGQCYPPDEEGCPIQLKLDAVIESVLAVKSSRMDPYVERLRLVVCDDCRNQDEQHHCRLRDAADCALDDYFGLLVEIIEEEAAKEGEQGTRNTEPDGAT